MTQTVTLPIRTEWVKMFYPDIPKGIPVGQIYQYAVSQVDKSPVWAFYRRTDDTAHSSRMNSPMGLDVGTLFYLRSLDQIPDELHFWPEGSPIVYRVPLVLFEELEPVLSVTTSGAKRTRLFLPISMWAYMPFPGYTEPKIEYWQVTHIREDGSVIDRKWPR